MGRHIRGAQQVVRDLFECSNLTASRERELLRQVHSGADKRLQQAALIELWESHSKLVVAIASRYRHPKVEFLDLVGAGHLGLHAAIARFDPERFETRLSTYAMAWIRWHIQDYLRRNAGPVRLPASSAHRQLMQMGSRLYAEAQRSCVRDQVEATESEICHRIGRRIGLPGEEVASSLRLIRGVSVSLDGGAPEEGVPMPDMADTLADDSATSEDAVILRLDHAKARKRIMTLAEEILGERERMVFFARCMADSDDVVQLGSLAAELGVSAERVHQLEASAKRKIATALAREGFTDALRNGQPLTLPGVRAQRRRATAVRLGAGTKRLRQLSGVAGA